jgi:hypothetical protein
VLNISISEEKTVIRNPDKYMQWTIKTTEVFGTVYAALENHFPMLNTDELSERIVKHVWQKMRGSTDENEVWILGLQEIGSSFLALKSYIDNREVIVPTFEEVEEIRIQYFMTVNYLPEKIGNYHGMRFENLKSVTQIMIAILYYYTLNHYKLVRCKHCGRWFATKTLKEEYCKRVSPCFGEDGIINGKTPLSCEQAVRNIKQKQARRRRNIYEYLCNYAMHQEEIDNFKEQCKQYKETITKAPTVENFRKYEAYLYSDKFPKRMVKR